MQNPVAAMRFAPSYLKRVLRERVLHEPWLYVQLDPLVRRYVSRKHRLRKISLPEVCRLRDQLDDLLNNRLTVLGKTLDFGNKIDWYADFEGGEWPRLPSYQYKQFCANDFSLPQYRKHGDIKRVWDLNNQHHFVQLAWAYKESHDPKFQNQLLSQFVDWISTFPYDYGIGWSQSMTVTHRAINWIICYNLGVFPQELHALLTGFLFYHGKYLSQNLSISYTGRNNNHIIGELAALHLIGLTLQKRDWTNNSLKMLLREINKQVYEDGVHYEQSSGYHRLVLEFLALVWYANGRRPELLTEVIFRMSKFLNDIAREDGTLPFLSDWDGASVWVLDKHRPTELLMLGRRSSASVAYPQGGYYILNGSPFRLIFDCGPVGMGAKRLVTHGHSDLLSFCLDVESEPFIVDPGSGTYSENRKIHDYFRSTCGHNTITVDGRDQCGLAGTWTLKRHPHAKVLFWKSTEDRDLVCGEHDGYQPITHRREIELVKRPTPFIRMYDDILGDGVHSYQSYLHLSPNVTAEISGTTVKLLSSKSHLQVAFEPTLTVREVTGLFAPDYGKLVEVPVLVFEGKSSVPTRIGWKYTPCS